MVTIIVAYDENRVIGCKGRLPWHIKEDMASFKKLTLKQVVIMGRKTWDSLPENYKPLPNRPNIIVSRKAAMLEKQNKWSLKEVYFESDLSEAIGFASEAFPDKEIFIIGGEQIYRQSLEQGLVDKVIASEIKGIHEGDVFFPELPIQGIEIVKSRKLIQEFDDFCIVEYVL